MKRFFISPHIVPDAAIVDPSLTVSLPPKTAAGSGLDALSHAIEGIISLNSTSLTQAIGLEAIKLISNNIKSVL
jgi:alcohol dehydrogenase